MVSMNYKRNKLRRGQSRPEKRKNYKSHVSRPNSWSSSEHANARARLQADLLGELEEYFLEPEVELNEEVLDFIADVAAVIDKLQKYADGRAGYSRNYALAITNLENAQDKLARAASDVPNQLR